MQHLMRNKERGERERERERNSESVCVFMEIQSILWLVYLVFTQIYKKYVHFGWE
jgi:hypothetical protein